jgi:hypothetical protein
VGHVPEYRYELQHHLRLCLRACENELRAKAAMWHPRL